MKNIFLKNPLIKFLNKYSISVPALILYMSVVELVNLFYSNILFNCFAIFVSVSFIVIIMDLFHKLVEILRGDYKEINT